MPSAYERFFDDRWTAMLKNQMQLSNLLISYLSRLGLLLFFLKGQLFLFILFSLTKRVLFSSFPISPCLKIACMRWQHNRLMVWLYDFQVLENSNF